LERIASTDFQRQTKRTNLYSAKRKSRVPYRQHAGKYPQKDYHTDKSLDEINVFLIFVEGKLMENVWTS